MSADTRPLVLLLEPDRDTAEMYAEFLELSAWRTEVAHDGASGVSKAIALAPDAITTEYRLPIVDGVNAARILKSDPATASIPIIGVTAESRPAEIERLSAAGCALVLTKPCLPERLLETLRETIARARSARARSAELRDRVTRLTRHCAALQLKTARLTRPRPVNVRTTTPEIPPPPLRCPTCSASLEYRYSVIGGVPARREQWDYLHCPKGCGTFQYRQRTHRVRPA